MEDFNLVRGFEVRPPIWTIAYKAVVYAIVFILFYVAEETVAGLLRGDTLRASIPRSPAAHRKGCSAQK